MTCYQGRVYARRRDGRLLRFKDRRTFDVYRVSMHETQRSLRIIGRGEFIEQKRKLGSTSWIHSEILPGMSLLTER